MEDGNHLDPQILLILSEKVDDGRTLFNLKLERF